jgi:hypothetical protein
MKALGLFLLVSGWIVMVSAIALLRPAFIPAFAVAGFAVDLLGLVLLARAHTTPRLSGFQPRQERGY